ncbi:hypothetical protein ILUMI_00340 [Ignelater luminosus]|uniref:Sodium/potassium-transporting ATPase subunit beta-2 n=1 Tax=Ignelater luminosus TaxID=2038154 RepID=A0A8K0GMQ8_IGNLU|nr:hypothetical protein ILUMI_00340 [Ignelater luminosus]
MAIPGKESENGVYEFPYMIKPSQKTTWEAIKTGIWDPSTKQFLGRTAKSWFQILIFYCIFYAALAALFAICMAVLYSTLDKDRPTYSDERSLIGTNPGLGFRPIAETEEGALIYYNIHNKTSQEKYSKLIKTFLEEYDVNRLGLNSSFAPRCDFDDIPEDGKACPVPLNGFAKCNGPNYGYNTSSPCVFLKLNKIYDWIPKPYNTSEKLPKEMPEKFREEVIELDIATKKGNQVWVSCQGEYPADKEHITKFEYFPGRGLPAYYFPYKHKKTEYLSPLVAVRLVDPKPGVLINIECRAWADNIKYEGGAPEQRKGSVHFEIMWDE